MSHNPSAAIVQKPFFHSFVVQQLHAMKRITTTATRAMSYRVGGRDMMSHFWSRPRDDILGEIFVALTLAAAVALLLY